MTGNATHFFEVSRGPYFAPGRSRPVVVEFHFVVDFLLPHSRTFFAHFDSKMFYWGHESRTTIRRLNKEDSPNGRRALSGTKRVSVEVVSPVSVPLSSSQTAIDHHGGGLLR